MLSATSINIWAVLVAALVNMALGALWYSPVLFVNPWSKIVGRKLQDLRGRAAIGSYVSAAVASLVMAYVLALMIDTAQARDVVGGASVGFWLWLGFVATTTLVDYVFAGHGKKLYFINVGYPLISLIAMGALLAAWK